MATATKKPKATKAKPRSKRTKPTFLPGMEPPSVPEIDQAADTYYEAMMERTVLSQTEKEAQASLMEKMLAHGLNRYETPDGLVVVATSKTKCSVAKKKEPKGESNGDGEE